MIDAAKIDRYAASRNCPVRTAAMRLDPADTDGNFIGKQFQMRVSADLAVPKRSRHNGAVTLDRETSIDRQHRVTILVAIFTTVASIISRMALITPNA